MRSCYIKLLIVILLFSGRNELAKAQEIEVTASEKEGFSSLMTQQKIIGHDANYFYVVKYVGSRYFLEKRDKNLNSVLEESIKLFKGLATLEYENLIHFHNELYLFVSYRGFAGLKLYYQKIDKGTLLAYTELIELTTIEFIKGNWADIHFALSRNEKKLLIACRTKLAWSGTQFNEYYVFGEGLSLDWKRRDSFRFRGQGPRDNKYIVDEAGNVSILSLLKQESIFTVWNEVKNMYAIYRYTNNGNDFKEYPLTLPEMYIRGIKITGNEKGEMICAGLYSEIFKAGVRGTFFFKIDSTTGNRVDFNLNAFDDALLSQLAAMKDPLIRNDELMDYGISDLVYRKNGKILIIAEQVLNQSYNNFNNLIVTCFDTNGQVYWKRVIRKKQSFSYKKNSFADIGLSDYRNYIRETGFIFQNLHNNCSYALMAPLDKSGIILYYNDDIRNISSAEPVKAFGQLRKSYIKAVIIDEYGNLSEKQLIKWKKKALFPEPVQFYDTLSDTIVIPAFRNQYVNYYKIVAKGIPL